MSHINSISKERVGVSVSALLVALGLIITLNTGCAPISIDTTVNSKFNFSALKTFSLVTNQQTGSEKLPIDKSLLDKTIINKITSILTNKGFNINEASNDFLVSYYIVIEEKSVDLRTINNYYSDIGYDPHPINSFDHRQYTTINVAFYQQGTLIIDIIDNKTKEIIWRGSAQSPLGVHNEDTKKLERAEKAIVKILKEFPPD